jgi:uncharacterized cupredoxin-like copper-binding protein
VNDSRRSFFRKAGLTLLGGLVAPLLTGRPALAHEEHGEEADLEVRMGEFYFKEPDGEVGTPFRLEAGTAHLMHFVNEGVVDHEIHFGRNPDLDLRGYRENLFGPGTAESSAGFLGLHLKPGEMATLHVLITEELRGEWEMGCFIAGHYEAGQRNAFIIE